MDLGLSEEQRYLRDSVRQIMRGDASQDKLLALQTAPTGYVPAIWDRLREGGWLGILVPEQYGGTGASLSEAAVVFEEFGSGPLPQLYITATSISPMLVLELGTPAQRERILPSIANGGLRITAAVPEREASWAATHLTTTLTKTADGYRLDGEKMHVPDALGATHALVAARDADTGHAIVALIDLATTGATIELLDGFTSWECRVALTGVSVAEEDVLGEAGTDALPGIRRAMKRAIPMLCAYQVGSAQAAFDMTLNHSRTRVQFGQPIGRFQRVQDHVIDVINHVDSARWLTYEAIWKVENQKPGVDGALHLAKSVVAQSHWDACNASHEVHAGIGADMQYGLAKHTYLSHALYHFLGSPAWHREQLAQALAW
jgi:alkylation response protein AidB-like acyl-CoA dehydrogenase